MPKILIVEDEEKMRRIYRGLFNSEHYNMLEAESAQSAVGLLEKNRDIGLVVLDLQMPIVSGDSLFEFIRRRYGVGVKILVSSVYPLEKQRRLAPAADGYHQKTEGVDILLEKVKGLL